MVDDGPWLYYKLTNEPKGSGELKNSREKKEVKKKNSPTLFHNKGEIVNKTFYFFRPNEFPQHMFFYGELTKIILQLSSNTLLIWSTHRSYCWFCRASARIIICT